MGLERGFDGFPVLVPLAAWRSRAEGRMPIGAIVSGTVLSHHETGLLVELDGSRAEAAVETFYVGVPAADSPALPPVGSKVTGVVKGYCGSQLRMSLLPSDLDRARIPD